MAVNYSRQFVTCDFDDTEISGAWIEVSVDGDSTATFSDFSKFPITPSDGPKTFCSVAHMAEWFKEQQP